MAGSIGLSLQQQFDKTNGKLLSGGRLYTFSAGTTTPQNVYKDQALTLAYPNPIELASDGRIPAFYVADGSIRARLTNKAGIVQFDTDNILVVGPSSGGGGGSSVDPTTIAQTGDTIWVPTTGTRAGWVRCNGLGIGSATSGAAQRPNADCQSLYVYIWNNFPNTICAIAGGSRGLNAAADWAADRAIATYDMRNKGPFGLSDMGNSAASGFAGVTFDIGDAVTAGASGGIGIRTVAQANLPNVTLTGTSTTSDFQKNTNSFALPQGSGNSYPVINNGQVTVSVPLGGSGTPLQTMPPFGLGTWYMKL